MTRAHAASDQKCCLEDFFKVLSLAFCHLSFIFVTYFSFFSDSNGTNYANDNISYSAEKDLMNVLNDLRKESDIIQE